MPLCVRRGRERTKERGYVPERMDSGKETRTGGADLCVRGNRGRGNPFVYQLQSSRRENVEHYHSRSFRIYLSATQICYTERFRLSCQNDPADGIVHRINLSDRPGDRLSRMVAQLCTAIGRDHAKRGNPLVDDRQFQELAELSPVPDFLYFVQYLSDYIMEKRDYHKTAAQ